MKYSDLYGSGNVGASASAPPKLSLLVKFFPVGKDIQNFEGRLNDWLQKVQERYEAVVIHDKGFFEDIDGEQFFFFWYGYREK